MPAKMRFARPVLCSAILVLSLSLSVTFVTPSILEESLNRWSSAGIPPAVTASTRPLGSVNLTSFHGLNAANPPPAVYWGQLAYDAWDGYTVLFGGMSATEGGSTAAELDGTWSYSHGTWKALSNTGGVSPDFFNSAGASITYDPVDHEVILVGVPSNGTGEQTWTFSEGRWTQLHPVAEPPARWYAAFAYDAVDREAVLYGGLLLHSNGSESWPSDTWVFANNNWTEAIQSGPVGSYQTGQEMAYDSETGTLVLLASSSTTGQVSTLVFDNHTWSVLAGPDPGIGGPLGLGGGMAFDPTLGELVDLPGGNWWVNQSTEFWTLNPADVGANWVGHFVPGSPAELSGMGSLVYDAADGYLLTVQPAPSLNVTGPDYTTETMVLDSADIGSGPSASVSVSPTVISPGTTFSISGEISGGFGYIGHEISVTAPGCGPISNELSLNCTATGPGTFDVELVVIDQANRETTVSLTVTVVEIPATSILVGAVITGTVAALIAWIGISGRSKSGN
jgi:hypothetical protein